jgi:hypothetical protein
MAAHPLSIHQERILRCVTDEALPASDLLGPDAVGPEPNQLSPDQLAVVLALRGLLACNLLQHCLQKRHGVDYGVNRCGADGVGQGQDGSAWSE